MYINNENLKYVRGKSAKQVFNDIDGLAEYYIGKYRDTKNVDISVIPNVKELIK